MRWYRILFVFTAVVVTTSLLSSCGACVAGLGSCDAYKDTAKNNKDLQNSTMNGNPPDGKLALGCKSWGQCWTYSDTQLALIVNGAAGGTYKLQVHDNMPGEITANNTFYLKTTNRVKTKVRVLDSVI